MSTQDTVNRGAVGTVTLGGGPGVVSALSGSITGGKHSGQSSWQSGSGPETWTPEELATKLGTYVGQIGYDSNQGGSFEANYNQYLNQLTPDLLVKRYDSLNNGNYFNTGLDKLQKQAYDTAKSILGRGPSGSEFAQILPAFQGPNGLMTGRAFLSNLAQQYKSNPNLDPSAAQNNRNPQDTSNSITQQFQSILGRAPTADELAHFSQAIQSNQTDAYGLGSFLKTQPEYTNAQDKNFRGSLNDELQGYDQTAFDRMKGDVVSDYASRGFAPGASPSLDYALTDLMGKITENRSKYLTQLSANQYGGNKDLATSDYKDTLNQMYSDSQSRNSANSSYGQSLLDRGFSGADYDAQKNDFTNYLNSNRPNNSNNMWNYLNTGINAINAGANVARSFR